MEIGIIIPMEQFLQTIQDLRMMKHMAGGI